MLRLIPIEVPVELVVRVLGPVLVEDDGWIAHDLLLAAQQRLLRAVNLRYFQVVLIIHNIILPHNVCLICSMVAHLQVFLVVVRLK